jgi:hypothetical protein
VTRFSAPTGRVHPAAAAPGNAEDVLDAVFDFAENLIAQQRAFAKQMLRAATTAQQATLDTATTTQAATGPTDAPSTLGAPSQTTTGESATSPTG